MLQVPKAPCVCSMIKSCTKTDESVIQRKGPWTYLLEFAISLELVVCFWWSSNISTAQSPAGSHLRAWIPTLLAHIIFRLIDLWWVMLNILIISWSWAVTLHLTISIFLLDYISSNKYLLHSVEEIGIPARWNKRRKLLHK